ncbi:MAG: hypothetical protein COB04_03100 [Gammaproteobacteria bacterium]|nr:MAG: hypothetical protein COB04_03100 [Gammaproteobacteria bacterium]
MQKENSRLFVVVCRGFRKAHASFCYWLAVSSWLMLFVRRAKRLTIKLVFREGAQLIKSLRLSAFFLIGIKSLLGSNYSVRRLNKALGRLINVNELC